FLVAFLRLVGIEAIGAQQHAEREIGSCPRAGLEPGHIDEDGEEEKPAKSVKVTIVTADPSGAKKAFSDSEAIAGGVN
ncbi:leucyl aminopeptidase, partial [Rhizobium leguminosarum]